MINKYIKGFSLIETLVAVLLLSLAITGPLTIASKGLNATLVAKDQFIAFYLAQDGMEQVRFMRDSACLSSGGGPTGCPSGSWLTSLNACLTSVNINGCYLDSLSTNPPAPLACGTACETMRYDSDLKIFNYNSAKSLTAQRFIRTIKIDSASNPDEVLVTVTVAWSDMAGVTHTPITIRESIFRWQ